MKSRLIVAAVAFLGYAILDATPANAVPKYAHNSGFWSGANIWYAEPCDEEPGVDAGEPGAGEHATICADVVVTVNDQTAVALRVTLVSPTDPGTTFTQIDIDPAGADAMLTLGSGTSNLESTLEADSEIWLVDDVTYKAILKFVRGASTITHTVTGAGDIVGWHDDAQIQIDALTLSLTSSVEMRGHMHIMDGTTGAGTLDNQASVVADVASGTLDIEVTGNITDPDDSYRWQVIAGGAKLRFLSVPDGETQVDLSGSFMVSDGGELWIGEDSLSDIDVITTGHLTLTSPDGEPTSISRIVVNGTDSWFVAEYVEE